MVSSSPPPIPTPQTPSNQTAQGGLIPRRDSTWNRNPTWPGRMKPRLLGSKGVGGNHLASPSGGKRLRGEDVTWVNNSCLETTTSCLVKPSPRRLKNRKVSSKGKENQREGTIGGCPIGRLSRRA